MQPIQMVDLKSQYHHIKESIHQSVLSVFESAAFINGKPVETFCHHLAAYLSVKHVIPCANGTDALQIALMSLDLQPGDEVITPSFTFIATAEVIALLKLKPVFVDVHPDTFCMDINAVEKAITPKTKAIVPVHLFGQNVDMEPLMNLAKQHNIYVIEDNAQAIGSNYYYSDGSIKKSGTIGHIGTTSFFPSKNLGCFGDGGAIFTNDNNLATKIKMIANHGSHTRYYHEVVGCNSRLDTIQAAILDVKLNHLNAYNEARKNAANFYNQAFKDNKHITTPTHPSFTDHVYHQYTLLIKSMNRDALQQHLASKHIPSMIYYPVPGHRQKMFGEDTEKYDLPVTEWLTERVISLPMHTELSEEQLTYITQTVNDFLT